MSKIHAYIRVSTQTIKDGKSVGQTTDNQRDLITNAGFSVDQWWSESGVSGSIKATKRPSFAAMLSTLEKDDTVIITMIDRLGRSASDILNNVEMFKEMGVKLRVIQFDGIDLTSSVGKMLLTCMAAMAELERNITIERIHAGLSRAKSEGKKMGGKYTITPAVMQELLDARSMGVTLANLSEDFNIPINTVAVNVRKWKGKMEEYTNEYNAKMEQYGI